MEKERRKIVLCYRKIIDAHSGGEWEKWVHTDTYRELKMQFQLFDPEKKYQLFSQLSHANNQAEKLHFLVSAAVRGYLTQLNNKLPDIKNNLGKSFLTFSNYQFEIIESDVKDSKKHVVAVCFFSDPMIWHATVGDYLLLSRSETNKKELLTHLLPMQPFVSIYSMENI